MQHARRSRLKVNDVDLALKVRNLEPLWGFATTSHLPFKKISTTAGTVYAVEDEEIDLGKVLKGDMPSVPRDISFTGSFCRSLAMATSSDVAGICSALVGYRGCPAARQGESVACWSVWAFLRRVIAR